MSRKGAAEKRQTDVLPNHQGLPQQNSGRDGSKKNSSSTVRENIIERLSIFIFHLTSPS